MDEVFALFSKSFRRVKFQVLYQVIDQVILLSVVIVGKFLSIRFYGLNELGDLL